MGAALLGRCPAFAAFCKPWESQVFGKVLLARMKAEDAIRKRVSSTAPFPHHKYKRLSISPLLPALFAEEIEFR